LILRLKPKQVELLKQEATKTQPIEAGAILFGKQSNNQILVEKIQFEPNTLKSPARFQIDPARVAIAITQAEKENLDLVGLFHSHPAPAFPSQIDLKYMKLWGDAIWLILSTTDGDLAAYQLIGGQVKTVTIKVG